MDDVDTNSFDLNAIDSDFIENPFPVLNALRLQSPVHKNPDGSVFLTRYDDVRAVYQSREMSSDKKQVFGVKFGDTPLYTHHTTSLIFNDPPYHTVVRKLLSVAFTPRRLSRMVPLIEQIVDELLDNLEERKSFDFISEFATALPTNIISFMLGIPPEYRSKLRDFSIAILGALDPVVPDHRLATGNQAVSDFAAILGELIDHRRRHPEKAGPGEVLDALISGEENGRSLNDLELVQNCIFLLNAGHETTTSLVGSAIAMLLAHPDQYLRIKNNPDLIDTLVEETLRFQSPLQIGNRLAVTDIALPSGTRLEAGTYIHTSIAAANRDPQVFPEAEDFDIGRTPNKHLAFITGIHVCLGATLARIEGRIAIGRLIKRFPGLRSSGQAELMGLARFRGYKSLPVEI